MTQYIVRNKLKCDYRLQANALEFSKPLAEKHYVKMEELEDYINACYKDADDRNLPMGLMFTY